MYQVFFTKLFILLGHNQIQQLLSHFTRCTGLFLPTTFVRENLKLVCVKTSFKNNCRWAAWFHSFMLKLQSRKLCQVFKNSFVDVFFSCKFKITHNLHIDFLIRNESSKNQSKLYFIIISLFYFFFYFSNQTHRAR